MKYFPGDNQNRRAEPTLQPVDVRGVLPLMKPLSLLWFWFYDIQYKTTLGILVFKTKPGVVEVITDC